MAKKKRGEKKASNGDRANLGFEAKLCLAAGKFRNNMGAIERDNPSLGESCRNSTPGPRWTSNGIEADEPNQ